MIESTLMCGRDGRRSVHVSWPSVIFGPESMRGWRSAIYPAFLLDGVGDCLFGDRIDYLHELLVWKILNRATLAA